MSINTLIVAPAWITITVTRFIKGRIDPPINYATLHKLASRGTTLSLSLLDQLIDPGAANAAHRVTQSGLRRRSKLA